MATRRAIPMPITGGTAGAGRGAWPSRGRREGVVDRGADGDGDRSAVDGDRARVAGRSQDCLGALGGSLGVEDGAASQGGRVALGAGPGGGGGGGVDVTTGVPLLRRGDE